MASLRSLMKPSSRRASCSISSARIARGCSVLNSASVSALRLFERLPRHPIVTVASAMKLLDTSKPTATRAIEVLAEIRYPCGNDREETRPELCLSRLYGTSANRNGTGPQPLSSGGWDLQSRACGIQGMRTPQDRHAFLPRNPSASAESASANCCAVFGGGSGILRLRMPVAGSRSIHGCAGALGSLAAARAATNCAPTWTKARHGSA